MRSGGEEEGEMLKVFVLRHKCQFFFFTQRFEKISLQPLLFTYLPSEVSLQTCPSFGKKGLDEVSKESFFLKDQNLPSPEPGKRMQLPSQHFLKRSLPHRVLILCSNYPLLCLLLYIRFRQILGQLFLQILMTYRSTRISILKP